MQGMGLVNNVHTKLQRDCFFRAFHLSQTLQECTLELLLKMSVAWVMLTNLPNFNSDNSLRPRLSAFKFTKLVVVAAPCLHTRIFQKSYRRNRNNMKKHEKTSYRYSPVWQVVKAFIRFIPKLHAGSNEHEEMLRTISNAGRMSRLRAVRKLGFDCFPTGKCRAWLGGLQMRSGEIRQQVYLWAVLLKGFGSWF